MTTSMTTEQLRELLATRLVIKADELVNGNAVIELVTSDDKIVQYQSWAREDWWMIKIISLSEYPILNIPKEERQQDSDIIEKALLLLRKPEFTIERAIAKTSDFGASVKMENVAKLIDKHSGGDEDTLRWLLQESMKVLLGDEYGMWYDIREDAWNSW